jgi:hypothetical protein
MRSNTAQGFIPMIAILAGSRILSGVTRLRNRNRSSLHWDLIRDLRKGGRMSVNGRVFQGNGRFV